MPALTNQPRLAFAPTPLWLTTRNYCPFQVANEIVLSGPKRHSAGDLIPAIFYGSFPKIPPADTDCSHQYPQYPFPIVSSDRELSFLDSGNLIRTFMLERWRSARAREPRMGPEGKQPAPHSSTGARGHPYPVVIFFVFRHPLRRAPRRVFARSVRCGSAPVKCDFSGPPTLLRDLTMAPPGLTIIAL